MQFRWLAAVAAMCFTGMLASAQPKATEPTIEVRLRSVNDLIDKFEYIAGLAGKEDAVTQVRELVKVLSADGKGIEGIDPKKPIGAYATLTPDVTTSPVVILIPIADQEQLVKALNARFGITPEKGEGGTLKIAVPFINEVHLRFANGYLYISQKANDLDAKTLIKPATYFEKDSGAVASVIVHVDRIPADLKTLVTGQIELGINEERKKGGANESEAEKKFKNFAFDSILTAMKGLTDDCKQLIVQLFIDPKTDELSAEVSLTAKSGSAAAKNFAAIGNKTSLPAGIVAATNTAARMNVKVAVTDGMKKEYAATIDALFDVFKMSAGDQGEAIAKQVIAAIGPTLKAGELDVASSLIGPDAKGHYQIINALAVKDGKEIEKLIKGLVKQFGPLIEQAVTFKLDVETIGDFNLHQIEIQQVDEKFEKIFGTKTLWLATSDKCIVMSLEPDGATIRKGLKAKAVPVPAASGELALAKLLPLIQPDLKPDELKALLKDAFGDGTATGKDTLSLSVDGGEKLTVRLKAKGKAIRLGAGLDLLKGK